jgi:hypothetical protein
LHDDGGAPIVIEVELTRADIAAAERALRRRPEVRRLRRWSAATELVTILGLLGLSIRAGGGWFLVAYLVVVVRAALQTKWRREERGFRIDQGVTSVSIDELGFTTTTGGIVTQVPWANAVDVEPASKHLLVRLTPALVEVWPRRCFAPRDDERAVAYARAARSAEPA